MAGSWLDWPQSLPLPVLLLLPTLLAFAYALREPLTKQFTIAKLPTPKPSSWLFGHLQMLRSDNHRVLRQAAKQLGGIYRLRVFHQQVSKCSVCHNCA